LKQCQLDELYIANKTWGLLKPANIYSKIFHIWTMSKDNYILLTMTMWFIMYANHYTCFYLLYDDKLMTNNYCERWLFIFYRCYTLGNFLLKLSNTYLNGLFLVILMSFLWNNLPVYVIMFYNLHSLIILNISKLDYYDEGSIYLSASPVTICSVRRYKYRTEVAWSWCSRAMVAFFELVLWSG